MVQCLWCKRKCTAKYGPFGDLCKEHYRCYSFDKQRREFEENTGYYIGTLTPYLLDKKTNTRDQLYHAYHDAKKRSCVRRIQRAWRRCIANPTYAICKKRLMSEFDELSPQKCD